MKFKIVRVDMDGYNGREHHPERTDVGLVVTAVKMETQYFSETGDWGEVIDKRGDVYPPALRALNGTSDTSWDCVETVWTCVTEDGRVLELMGHEVEEVR